VDGKFPFELNLLCNNVVNFVGTFAVMITLKWQLVFPTALSVVLFYRLQQ
jgi:ATP-binding cassette subfamily C (CFTR/MRP) protein 10